MVALLGLVGTPPLAVFAGKLTVATAGWDGGRAWLAVVLLANTVVSLFYYLRWIGPAYCPGKPDTGPGRPWAGGAAVSGAIASVVLGIGAGAAWAVLDGPLVL